MSGVSDVVPAYRLRQEDLEEYLGTIFPDHAGIGFKVQVCLSYFILIKVACKPTDSSISLRVTNTTSQFQDFYTK